MGQRCCARSRACSIRRLRISKCSSSATASPTSHARSWPQLAASDERIKFFDNPKGPRHGELHRHKALNQARGEIVCYLSDDDLWLPRHVEELQALLAECRLRTHPAVLVRRRQAACNRSLVDLEQQAYRELLLGGENRMPLSCVGHTLAFYRRLPAGWRTTPAGTFTDLYMWQQILSAPGCRAVSGSRLTVLNFPSPARQGWSIDQRLAELDEWTRRLDQPTLEGTRSQAAGQGGRAAPSCSSNRSSAFARRSRLDEHDRAALYAHARRGRARPQRGSRGASTGLPLNSERSTRNALPEQQLDELATSATWRLRTRLLGLPPLGSLLRWAARVLARRAAPEATGLAASRSDTRADCTGHGISSSGSSQRHDSSSLGSQYRVTA